MKNFMNLLEQTFLLLLSASSDREKCSSAERKKLEEKILNFDYKHQ